MENGGWRMEDGEWRTENGLMFDMPWVPRHTIPAGRPFSQRDTLGAPLQQAKTSNLLSSRMGDDGCPSSYDGTHGIRLSPDFLYMACKRSQASEPRFNLRVLVVLSNA